MQDNDLNIEDFKEIFIKSFFGETVNTQEISDYFEFESERFKNKFSNENHTQRIKDIIFKKFIKGIEEANTNLSNPFIEQEQKRSLDMMEWQGKGIDISEMEKPSRYNQKIPLPYLCKRFGFGVHIELEQIEYIYQGFKLFKQQHEEDGNIVIPIDNQWIKDIVKEKYKYYGFEEHIGLNYDFPFMEHKKGDIDFNNQKWTSVNWYIKNLNTVHRDLLNNLEMLPKEKVKEQILFAYNKQIETFQDWDLRQGVYVEYFNSMEKLSKLLGSQTPDGYYDIYRLKWLFISSCFIKFYKFILDKYFLEKSEATAPPTKGKPTIQQTGFNLGYSETQLKALHKALTDNNFLDNQTEEAHFINAFNGELLTNFEKLKWIDKTPKNNAGETGFNTQTLLEFLYLLEMKTLYYDTLPSNQENFYRLIERVFEGIVNIQAKNVTKTANQKTQRQKLLNTILQGFKS